MASVTITTFNNNIPETVSTITSDGNRIIWGFMFENTLFTEFECRNHPIIEAAYRQRKKKHSSHHITIVDSNLPKPGKARVYFGVAQNHLRMPGTRYYVTRRVIKNTTPAAASPFSLPMLMPSPTSTFSSSSFSSLDTSSSSSSSALYQQPTTKKQQHFNHPSTSTAVFSNDLPLVDYNYNSSLTPATNSSYSSSCYFDCGSNNTSNDLNCLTNNNYYYDEKYNHFTTSTISTTTTTAAATTNNTFIPDFNTNMLEDPNWFDDILRLGPPLPSQSPFQEMVSWTSNNNNNNSFNDCNSINNLTTTMPITTTNNFFNDSYLYYYYNNLM